MKFKTLKEGIEFGLANNEKTLKEFICPKCEGSFFHVRVNKPNQWEIYGLWLHTVCLFCGHTKNGAQDVSFKKTEHDLLIDDKMIS